MKSPCPRLARHLACALILSSLASGSSNLLTNPGAETGSLTGWVDPLGNGFGVGGAPQAGSTCFWGGQTGPLGVYSHEIRQDIDVSNLAAAIDAGQATSFFRGWGRSNSAGGYTDTARMLLEFLSAGGSALASFDTGTVLPVNAWNEVGDTRTVPGQTRVLRVRLLATRPIGQSTDAFFDSLWLSVGNNATTYCAAGVSASGCQASLSAAGVASATAPSGFALAATAVEGNKDGLFFFGTNGRQANPWGNGTSFQCVTPPVARAGQLVGTGTNGSCDGSFSQDLNALWCATCSKPAKNPGAGAVVQAQLWYRDPLNTSSMTTSLSDGIEFHVGP